MHTLEALVTARVALAKMCGKASVNTKSSLNLEEVYVYIPQTAF